jgi:hypothetical protein
MVWLRAPRPRSGVGVAGLSAKAPLALRDSAPIREAAAGKRDGNPGLEEAAGTGRARRRHHAAAAAGSFAADLRLTDSGVAVAVGSRGQESAERFGDRFGVAPHPMHHDNAPLALRAGKQVA